MIEIGWLRLDDRDWTIEIEWSDWMVEIDFYMAEGRSPTRPMVSDEETDDRRNINQ